MKRSQILVYIGVFILVTAGTAIAQVPVVEEDGQDPVAQGDGQDPVAHGDGQSDSKPMPKIPRTLVDKATIEFTGKTLSKGQIALVVDLSTGQSYEVHMSVVGGMKDKEIAGHLTRELQFNIPTDALRIENKGNKIEFRRAKKDKTTTFGIRFTDWNVFNVGVRVTRS